MDFEKTKKLTAELIVHLTNLLEKQGFNPLDMMPVILHAFFVVHDVTSELDKDVGNAGLFAMQAFLDDAKKSSQIKHTNQDENSNQPKQSKQTKGEPNKWQ